MGATIPCGQYSNMQPEIELEGDDLDELHKQGAEYIEKVWAEYGERPLNKNTKEGKVIESFTGEQVIYDDDAHKYYDMDGNTLLGGSTYASQQSTPFNKDGALIGSSKKYKVNKDELGEVWDLLGDVSRNYGTAVHNALELYHKHHELGNKVAVCKDEELNYALSKLPHIRECVQGFIKTYGVDALTEVMVSDVERGMAGQIDRLEVLDKKKKVCRIGDYKTNYQLTDKKIKEYQHQLSFYAHILMSHGWTVEGLDIYHYDGSKWVKVELEVLDLVPQT